MLLSLLGPLLLSCNVTPDYGLESPPDEPAPPQNLMISFNMWIQRGDWGTTETGCQVELAFYEWDEEDGYGSGQEGQLVTLPEEPGQCRLSFFDPEEELTPGLIGVRGSLSAGDLITLRSEEEEILLLPFEDEQGQLSYRMEDCSSDSFPYGSVFDLEVPGSSELEGFVAEGAVVVVSDIEMLSPDPEAWSGQLYPLDPDEDMELRWSYLQDRPESVTEQELFFMHVQDEEMRQLEVLACWPEERGQLTLSQLILQTLTMNGPEQRDYGYGMQVDVTWDGPEWATPSGQLNRVRSRITLSGMADFRDWSEEPEQHGDPQDPQDPKNHEDPEDPENPGDPEEPPP